MTLKFLYFCASISVKFDESGWFDKIAMYCYVWKKINKKLMKKKILVFLLRIFSPLWYRQPKKKKHILFLVVLKILDVLRYQWVLRRDQGSLDQSIYVILFKNENLSCLTPKQIY